MSKQRPQRNNERANTYHMKKAAKVLQIHPVARKFPTLPAKEYKELKEDIETNGVELPILVNKKKDTLIDGRNRWMIATELGISDKVLKDAEVFKGKDDEIPAVILSRNLFRRHLTDDQRISLLTEIRAPELEKDAAERKKSGTFAKDGAPKGSVAEQLADEAKVTKYKAEQAMRARKRGTLGDVIKGKKSLPKAAGKRKPRKEKKPLTLEDEVWNRFERFINYWPQTMHAEVKKHLRKFLSK
jgi:hypothetical protein